MAEWDVPGYTELKALGSGGFGDVVLARHNVSGTLVAIKYLHGDLLADQEFAEMFRGEATVLASLDDPNVVRLYEYVESPSGAAIVMELINGVSLREILTHQGRTTAEAALVVLQGSLLGLAAAHRYGVVHRDYKPENVLVDGGGASKLTDFGIAARAGDRPVPAGTLAYAPPEQFASAPARPAGDVYAATATFYECLTGRPPFSGESTAALLLQHRSEPVPLEPVPAPLRPLVAAGMAKDPGQRPTDANTFVTALKAAASGAYGPDWEDRGRSHLGEAALLLAALWPSGEPPAVQGTTVERISLFRRIGFRRIGAIKAAMVAGVAIAVVAAGTALAATGSLTRPSASNQPITVQPVALQPSSPPAVTGVSPPPRRTTAGGTGATITGTGLGGTTGVSLGGSHSLLPAVTGVSPAGGSPAGGTSVTITGTGLSGATRVSFGRATAKVTADSGTQITVASPASAGTVDISVTTPAGASAATAADHFTYTTAAAPPAVTGVSPASGSPAGGTGVTITGTGLSGATGVSFGGTPATVTADSGTQVTATSPPGKGTVDITVTTPVGTSAATAADNFTYAAAPPPPPPAPPMVTGVSPPSGSIAGGTGVTITGTGLSGATGVSFGGTPATVTADSGTQITVISPPGKGTVDITVTTPAGTSAATAADNFAYYVVVANVVGQSQAQATSTLQGQGLAVTTSSTGSCDATDKGNVVTQDPPAGTSVSAGASVSIGICAATVKTVVVANVVGQSQAQATSTLRGQGLAVMTSSTSSCDATDKGNVVTQDPPAGTSVSAGASVSIGICAATVKTVVVANVVGQSQAQATSTLRGQGLAVTTSSTSSCDATDNGNVVTQNPPAGTSVSAGASVSIGICAATVKTVVVANVVGQSQAQATSTLRGQGLAVTTSSTSSCDATDNGNVVTQAPLSGTSVSVGTAVTISICAATVKTVVVANVVGQSQTVATSTLRGQGLAVTTSSTSSCDATDNGNVVTQAPLSGTSVSVGTAVTISICAATVKTVVVANVVGQTEAQATSTLRGQGLAVTTSSTSSCATTDYGNVVTQAPPAGTSVSAGSSVTIGICAATTGVLQLIGFQVRPPGHVPEPPWRACARRISDQLRGGSGAGSDACGRPRTSTTG